MNNVDNLISNIKKEIQKEKKTALTSIGKAKLEKEMKSHIVARELSALNNRAEKLKSVLSDISSKFSLVLQDIISLREKTRNKKLELVILKRDVNSLKGVEKEISPLQEKVNELVAKEAKEQKIVNAKRHENNIKSAELAGKEKELQGIFSNLKQMQARINELSALKRQKEELRRALTVQVKQLQIRLNNLVKSLGNIKEKQIKPLHSNIESLSKKKKESQAVHDKLKAKVSYLHKGLVKHTSALEVIEARQKALQQKVKLFESKIHEKEIKQKRLVELKKEIPLTEKKISELGKQEKELMVKKNQVIELKRKLRLAKEKKQDQKKKLQETIKKLKEQEEKIRRVSL